MNSKEQVDHYRKRIREMLKRVPDGVIGGSHGHAVAYKKVVTQATKVANAASPSLESLIQAHNQLSSYY
jgi:hypothetical protein